MLNLNSNNADALLRGQQDFKSNLKDFTGLSEFMKLWRIVSGNEQSESL